MKTKTKICAVIGSPISHSLSPVIHNAAFEYLQLPFHYRALEFREPELAIKEMLEKNYRGYSVTLPLKTTVIKCLDNLDPLTKKIGAVNTIINEAGKLGGFNTDVSGAITSIQEKMDITRKRVVLLGAGGAARAIGFGLKEKKAKIHIMNRTRKRAQKIAEDLQATFSDFKADLLEGTDLIINTTPVGMYPHTNQSIIDEVPEGTIIMDIVYNPLETKLLKLAKRRGCRTINGSAMFLYQAAEQFRLFTGNEPPLEIMKKTLLEKLT
ncbi:MAG: shikimate dehydrogenase [Candidatus Heimdallarchaeota archaeon]|nr:shikimate dehydrogenase [Candidatus Heimdallarchaeota archaeon]